MQELDGWPAAALALAALLTALVTIWKLSHLGDLYGGIRHFLLDWMGEPARPGVAARPSFPERMTAVEDVTAATSQRAAALNHDMRGELTSRLILLSEDVARIGRGQDSNAGALDRLDQRVTDHRRRNEEQILLLRQAIEEIRLRGQQRRRDDPPDPAS